MGRKRKTINMEELDSFILLHRTFKSHPVWTKEKYALRDEIDKFLNRFSFDMIERFIDYPKFSDGKAFLKWDYEIVRIPNDKRGFFSLFRGKRVFILCRDRGKWGCKYLYVFPVR